VASERVELSRPCEQQILSLRWEHVDLEKGLLLLSDAKAGARDVPLGGPAIAVLETLPPDGAYVVHGREIDQPLSTSSLETAWRNIRKKAKLDDVRVHDLRDTVGTDAGSAGHNAFVIRDLLGHKTLAMTNRYVERDAEPIRTAADQVAGKIAAAMEPKKARSKGGT